MSKKSVLLGIAIVQMIVFGVTLEGRAAPKEQQKKAVQAAKVTSAAHWDAVLQAAKGEGSLVVYSTTNPATKLALTKAMKDKYGITVDFIMGEPGWRRCRPRKDFIFRGLERRGVCG